MYISVYYIIITEIKYQPLEVNVHPAEVKLSVLSRGPRGLGSIFSICRGLLGVLRVGLNISRARNLFRT